MRTVWLASYPKSGNTWMRMLIANLSARDGEPVDINDLPEGGGIASARGPFDYLTLIDSSLLHFDEIDNLRPRVYIELARDADGDACDRRQDEPLVRFVKCHDAYTFTQNGEPLLGGSSAAAGAILIVRDPRDVAPSLASHNGSTIDQAIAMMGNAQAAFCGQTKLLANQLRQKLPGWSGHIASWLDQSDLPVHLVRYEDLQGDTTGELRRALEFAKRKADWADIERAVRLACFPQLQEQERTKGFREAPRPHAGGNFFRRGEAGAWRDELTSEQVALIERDHAPMMRRMGYAVVSDAGRQRAELGAAI